MNYLRALMKENELTARALDLTTHALTLNAAHYTVWQYRREILSARDSNALTDEYGWLCSIASENQKNYQIWYHRQWLIGRLLRNGRFAQPEDIQGEISQLDELLEDEPKNYHLWSFRVWLAAQTGLSAEHELGFSQKWIDRDIRNNSAWSYRFLVITRAIGQGSDPSTLLAAESRFTRDRIKLAPGSNPSTWNYLGGVYKLLVNSSPDIVASEIQLLRDEYGIFESPPIQFLTFMATDLARLLSLSTHLRDQLGSEIETLARSSMERLCTVDHVRRFYWQRLLDSQ